MISLGDAGRSGTDETEWSDWLDGGVAPAMMLAIVEVLLMATDFHWHACTHCHRHAHAHSELRCQSSSADVDAAAVPRYSAAKQRSVADRPAAGRYSLRKRRQTNVGVSSQCEEAERCHLLRRSACPHTALQRAPDTHADVKTYPRLHTHTHSHMYEVTGHAVY